MEQLLTLCH